MNLGTIPAIIKPMTIDEATIAMIDKDIQCEEILLGQCAFSLKMKMDAMRREGTSMILKAERALFQ